MRAHTPPTASPPRRVEDALPARRRGPRSRSHGTSAAAFSAISALLRGQRAAANNPPLLRALRGNDVACGYARLIERWAASLHEAQHDPNVNVVIVTGAGRAFCSGGDVGRMGTGDPTPLDNKNGLWEHIHRVPKTLEAMDKPVIAMINGVTVGAGMGMSLMCDMRIASDTARFSTGYVRVGLVPGDGDTYFLPRLIGTARALELLWTADFIEAPKALELGIVNRVVPHDKLAEETYAFARRVADGPQVPVRMIKRLVYQSMRLDLRTHLDLVSSHMAVVRETEDHREGVQAFKEKRAPKFKGR